MIESKFDNFKATMITTKPNTKNTQIKGIIGEKL